MCAASCACYACYGCCAVHVLYVCFWDFLGGGLVVTSKTTFPASKVSTDQGAQTQAKLVWTKMKWVVSISLAENVSWIVAQGSIISNFLLGYMVFLMKYNIMAITAKWTKVRLPRRSGLALPRHTLQLLWNLVPVRIPTLSQGFHNQGTACK